jgi:outer membrane protein OmpA-like peptidoglycan-associated protein
MDGEHGGGLASSLTDLMTSLALIFVFLLVAQMHNTSQESQTAREEVRRRLEEGLKGRALGSHVRVENDPNDPLTLLMILPEELMRFEYAKEEIPLASKPIIGQLSGLLGSTLCDPTLRSAVASLVVEGHTDHRGDDSFNIQLSQKRAKNVVLEMLPVLEHAPGASSYSFDCVIDLLSATGRGRREPLVSEPTTEEEHARNRRVVFKIRVKSSEQRRVMAGIPSAVSPDTMPR